MEQRKSISIPWELLVLDVVGAFSFAWGLYQYISEDKGTYYILVGVLLMMPLVLHILNLSPQAKK